MNKKMFIICAIFALIISCKNYASGEDLKQNVKGFLDKELMQGDDPNNNLFNPSQTLPASPHDNTPILKATQSGGQQEEKEDKGKEEIEKKIKELKSKIEKSDKKTTSLKTYSEYEEEIKKIREELEEKLKGKKEEEEKLEKELKDLDDSLKKKKEDREKALQEAKQKFEEFKRQVESATENTDKVKNQGKIGLEALLEARKLGVNGSYSNNDGTNTYDFVKKVIDDALKKIDEELKKLEDKKE